MYKLSWNGFFIKKWDYIQGFLKIGLFLILLSGMLFTSACRHAEIVLDPPEPASCRQGFLRRQACEIEKAEIQDRIQKNVGKQNTIVQKFYLWGFYPRNVDLDVTGQCGEFGIWKIHQYTTALQGLYSELSLGIFVPRTTDIKCY
jgi:hypothetical protein